MFLVEKDFLQTSKSPRGPKEGKREVSALTGLLSEKRAHSRSEWRGCRQVALDGQADTLAGGW